MQFRSMLFVPANQPRLMEKAPKYGADALILDLEDSVPPLEKEIARGFAQKAVKTLSDEGCRVFVRTNGCSTFLTSLDLEAIVQPGLSGVVVPKMESTSDVIKICAWLEHFEIKSGLEVGSVRILPWPETAKGISAANELAAASPRIMTVVNVAGGKLGDAAMALGYRTTPGRTETLFVSSHILLANRAAGLQYPITAGILEIRNLDAVQLQMTQLRDIGYGGAAVIHPSAVPLANKIFGPTEAEILWNIQMLEAMSIARSKGLGACLYDGMMVDGAHVSAAYTMLKQAEQFGMNVGPYPTLAL
jgi:citrate lyase subunit beta / citryl-CoA lyase